MMNKARKILMENGWFSDFYYIMKVMKRNEEEGTATHVAITRQWGRKVLENKLNWLCEKYPVTISVELEREASPYFDEIHDAGERAYDIVFNRIIEEDKNRLIEEATSHLSVAAHTNENE